MKCVVLFSGQAGIKLVLFYIFLTVSKKTPKSTMQFVSQYCLTSPPCVCLSATSLFVPTEDVNL